MYKIVDHRTGWESRNRFECMKDAEMVLEEIRTEYYDNATETDPPFSRTVAPANYTWQWDEEKRKHVWKRF